MFDERIHNLIVLIPALPLLAAVVTAALGPKWLRERSHWPTILALGGSCVLSLMLLLDVRQLAEASAAGSSDSIGTESVVTLWRWADIGSKEGAGSFDIAVALRVDPLTSIMLAMVTFISLLVAIYAAGYMHGDRGYWRFFSYVSLFVFSMTMLVSVSNFVLLYVFWEAVGLCSYLLIGFWYEKPEAAAAGKKAFLVNRIGDFGFALALFLIWTTYGTLNFHDTPGAAGVLGQTMLGNPALYVGGGVGLAICLLLMLGACGKSAQLPLHVWLPDAMEGPTPVSALIHAATMVTAGVYMVTRCSPLFVASPEAQTVVAVIGCATAAMAAIIALTQTDLKRVLAYSTISQLGFMFLGLGTGVLAGIVAGMFHLVTHAFFKALLFLGSGSVMHAMGGVIDMRRFGGLRRAMPITCITFAIGGLALAGVIPFAGYYSKDAILSVVHAQAEQSTLRQWLFYIAEGTALLTAFYTFRAFFLTFYGEERLPAEAGGHAHESPGSMTGPLVILAVGAVGVGFAMSDGFNALIKQTPSLAYQPLAEGPTLHLHSNPLFSTALALAGIAAAAFLYLGSRREVDVLARVFRPLYVLSYRKFFFDPIYMLLVVWPTMAVAWIAAWFDRSILDGLVNLIGRLPGYAGSVLRIAQMGLVPLYALLMALGLLILIGAIFV